MSDRLRFTTARQVFEAFPTAASDIEVEPADEAPLDFARKLLAPGRRFESIVYLAYLLPRREAVWWGCQCVRAISGNKADDALLAAEAWVRDPDETTRRAALDIGWSARRTDRHHLARLGRRPVRRQHRAGGRPAGRAAAAGDGARRQSRGHPRDCEKPAARSVRLAIGVRRSRNPLRRGRRRQGAGAGGRGAQSRRGLI